MVKTIKDNLCKGIRACGIPVKQSHQILNIVEKWEANNGPSWVVSRIKGLRQWYESSLAGNPKPPEWFKHSKEGYPLGIWKWVFNLPPQKALGILSLDTVFYEKQLSPAQEEKFFKGLEGGKTQSLADLKGIFEDLGLKGPAISRRLLPERMPKIPLPTLFDMNGSVPFNQGRSVMRPDGKLGNALEATVQSWKDIPEATFEFLGREGLWSLTPLSVLGNEYALELSRKRTSVVGRIGIIQEPELKARIVANPNRITQVTLDPLKQVYMDLAHHLATDVTFRQEEGVRWCRQQLAAGVTLAGSDLTSASDLLDLECCLELVNRVFGLSRISGYLDHVSYFEEISRGMWYFPSRNTYVQWKSGNPLGTGPSFGLLTLTNNASALLSMVMAKEEGVLSKELNPPDCFRVVGDDIIMRAEMSPYYTQVINLLGGEINHSKTIESDKVAEFAGRVITPTSSYLKKVKYSEPSDNSFMSYMSQLGSQAQYFLRPRQRKVWKHLAEVPGVVVDGPWMKDSYGIPFEERYQWYLEEVLPALGREDPDIDLESYEMVLLKAKLSLAEAGRYPDGRDYLPMWTDSYQESEVTTQFRSGGDPRTPKGVSLVDSLNQSIELGHIRTFTEWKAGRSLTSSPTYPNEGLPDEEVVDKEQLGSRKSGLNSLDDFDR